MPVKSMILGKSSASWQNIAMTVMLGLVAWLTFAQTRALQEAHKLVRESQAAADRADRICRQSAMITISVRELRDQILRQMPQEVQDSSVAMNEHALDGD
ncbi:MAG TPA: hypothetical protein VMV10_22855 [Pirellulales bacterium]|nr:hypothetical protein [Pirellulales bacterium]